MADLSERPDVPLSFADDVEHRRRLAIRSNASLPHDGTKRMTAPLKLKSYTVSTVPTASLYTGSLIYVSDETGGATVAFSNGSAWKRVQDLATIS